MVKVEITRESRRRLRDLEKRFPRTMRAAFGAAATRAQSRFRKVMSQGGGVYGVPAMAPHHEISTYLRPNQHMGGVLAEKERIVKYKVDADTQYIGWPDPLARWAVLFQTSDTHAFETWRRRDFHRRGIRDVPQVYQRPERDVVQSFADHLAGEWPEMVLAMFDKYYKSRMAKGQAVK